MPRVQKGGWMNVCVPSNDDILRTIRLMFISYIQISVTFDPFMYLTLPLPIQKKTTIKLTFVQYEPSCKPIRMTITLNKESTAKHLKEQAAKLAHIEDVST